MPSVIVNATKANWNLLEAQSKTIILKDVTLAIQKKRINMGCDKQMWLAFYDWILEKNNGEK